MPAPGAPGRPALLLSLTRAVETGARMRSSARTIARTGPRLALIACAALAVALAACGGDDEQQAQAETPAEQQAQSGGQEAAAQAAQPAAQQQAEPAPAGAGEADEPPAEEPEPAQQQEAQAQEPIIVAGGVLLERGVPTRGAIGAAGETADFRFEAAAGDWVRIEVDGKDGLDPIAVLAGPSGEPIASNDDVSRTNRDSLIYAEIATGGLQIVQVSGYGEATGTFDVTASRHVPTADNDSAVVAVDSAFEITGVLDTPNDVDVFEFDGRADQELFIYVDGAPGVDVYIQLFDASRSIVATDDDSGHGLDAELRYELPETGRYALEVWPAVTSATDGVQQRSLIGAYTVHLRENVPVAAFDDETGEVAAAGVSFLTALRGSDTATIYSLAGQEAARAWGWEGKADVDRDLDKLKSIPLIGQDLQMVVLGSEVSGDRAKLYIQFSDDDWFRIELSRSRGQWGVDAWTHSPAPPEPPAEAEESSEG